MNHLRRLWSALVALSALLSLAWAAPAGAGVLTFVEAQTNGVGGVTDLGGVTSVAVSPDGHHVYATSQTNSAVVLFTRNASSGRLSFVAAQVNGVDGVSGLGGASAVALTPDGKHVYVAGPSDSAVAAFSRDATTGALTFVAAVTNGSGGVDGIGGAAALAVSPDGKHVYVTGPSMAAVAVFSRDTTSGALTFVEAERNGSGGVHGLANARGVAVSPDGGSVYVAGRGDNAVAVFARDAASGALSFVETWVEGMGVTGLSRPNALRVSGDNAQVLVASFDQDLTVFTRDAASGRLTFLENLNILPGGPTALALSPDGTLVYATSFISSQLSELDVFRRTAATGRLTFLESYRNDATISGLRGAVSVAVSPDGADLYVGSQAESAVAVFTTRTTAACVGDCSGDGFVTIDELIAGVNIALGTASVDTCPSFDTSGDGAVTIDELLKAVTAALGGCPM